MNIKRKTIKSIVIAISLAFAPTALGNAEEVTVRQTKEWASSVASELVIKVSETHPRIFLTPERIPELIQEANGSKAKLFRLMKQRMKGPQAALFYALGAPESLGFSKGKEKYGRIAAAALMEKIRLNNKRTSPDNLAILYDWAYGALTLNEKNAFVTFTKNRLGNKVRVHNGKSHGYRTSPGPEGIIAALSFFGDGVDDAYAKKLLLQGIRDTLLDNLAMEQVAGKDGGFADGCYYIFSLGGTFDPFLALQIATGTRFFLDHEMLVRLPHQLMYAMLPFPISRADKKTPLRYFATFNDNWTATTKDYGSLGKTLVNRLVITAAELQRHGDGRRASLYMGFLKEAFGGISYQAQNPISFVLMDWTIQPISPGELRIPEAEALGWDEDKGEIDRDRFGKKAGIGWVCMRSAWNDPDATFAIFKAEPFYYHGHQHHDSLAFMIAKGEELALARAGNYMCWFEGGQVGVKNPGWPQMYNFFTQSISTSNLLIHDPNESFGIWGEQWANNGGQRFTPYWHDKWGRTYAGTANGNYRDIGGLIRFEQNESFVYAEADATRAYNSQPVTSGGNKPKVSLVQREFVYLKSPGGGQDYFVIFDRVVPINPELKTFWLLQLRAKPEFDGTHTVRVGDEAGGIHLSENTSEIRVKQERAWLFCKSLLPKEDDRIVRRLGGWITTKIEKPLAANDNGPVDIHVKSTKGLPKHPVVIITNDPPNPEREVFDKFSVWPKANHATGRAEGKRICYFCEGKTSPGSRPAKLLNCIRARKSAPGFAMPVGAEVRQEFRHMGIQGADKGREAERIDYPWGYGLGYCYGDGNQYGLWRIEVSPKEPSRFVNFLHVLHPTLKGEGLPDTRLIESETENLYGAMVGDKVVLFAKGSDPMEQGSYALKSKGRTWQLICNLKPEKEYEISQNGKVILTARTGKQGTLDFETQTEGIVKFEFKVKSL